MSTYSATSSLASSTDSACLPKSRIKCARNQIVVGESKFESATDALLAYLQQFDNPSENGLGNSNNSSSNRINEVNKRTIYPHQSPSSPIDLLSGKGGTVESHHGRNSSPLTSPLSQQESSLKSSKALAASGLVLGSNGINIAGTKEDVELLLTGKVSPKLQEEVTDTIREVKLRRLLKQAAMKSQKQTKTGLQQEVEAALLRSAQLLEKVTKEDIPSTKKAIVDADSTINTEILLNGSSLSLEQEVEELEERGKQLGHVYSYRTTRPQRSLNQSSLSQSLCAPVSYLSSSRPLRGRERRSSIDSLLPPHHLPPLSPHSGKRSSSSSSCSLSNQSDPTDVLRRIRSRSVSPGFNSRRNRLPTTAPEWVEQLDESVRKSVPSWVSDIGQSEVSESVWAQPKELLENRNNRRPNKVPSWVAEVEDDDVSDKTDKLHYYDTRPHIPMLAKPAKPDYQTAETNEHSYCESSMTDSRPGLNFSDLATTPASQKHVTFTNSTRRPGERQTSLSPSAARYEPKHSTPLKNGASHYRSDPSLARPAPSRVLDSEYNGEAFLRNNILPQTAKLKKSIDNFVTSSENLRRRSGSSNSSEASSGARCSSLDTLALLAGRTQLRTDMSGISPVPKDSNIGTTKTFSTSPAISDINGGSAGVSPTSNGHDHESSDGLDGDRSWERVTSPLKAPVHVDGGDSTNEFLMKNGLSPHKISEGTLSGGRQPGSMEALKNMLFKLQAEETSTQEGTNKVDTVGESGQHGNSNSSMAILPALQGYDFQQEPGGHSLEKALVHLNRLKKLVKNTATTEKWQEQEADSKTESIL